MQKSGCGSRKALPRIPNDQAPTEKVAVFMFYTPLSMTIHGRCQSG
uniref:Uncharacterized protein n=1 Tax=Nelumbo nucifera TaxID=4432 RepID=A0A822YUR9_NELNU|nr:TPA_asm: hypothetical protein HUJ06_011839 [Nelumbo nucifera]